jgi:pimeloyl-ACP methyl ester carboxylesterase
MKYDLFVSHASEDKDAVVRPLVKLLKSQGLHLWYDEDVLRLGDSLSTEIDRGLAESRYGLVVLSRAFFAKHWTRRELQGLVALDEEGRSKIFPIWHGVTKGEVAQYSPTLADVIAVDTARGLDHVVKAIIATVQIGEAPEVPVPEHSPRARHDATAVMPGSVAGRGTVIFVHGLYGDGSSLMALRRLTEDPLVGGWHFSGFAWSGRLFGAATSLHRVAKELVLTAENTLLQRPGKLVIVAHSVGGLIAMEAILSSEAVQTYLDTFVMIAVPTGGLRHSSLLGFLNRGVQAMSAGGTIITDLNARWSQLFADKPPFRVESIVASRDAVAYASSMPSARVNVIDATHNDVYRHPAVDEVLKKVLTEPAARGADN